MEPPFLSVASVARRLGVAPATLRTWARRYGLGPTGHVAGAHRRYSAEDVARLEHMRRLIDRGVPPVESARLARQAPEPGGSDPQRPSGSAPVDPDGGALALPGSDRAVHRLASAVMSLDAAAVTRQLTEAVTADGVLAAWQSLLCPVLVAVGRRTEVTGQGVEAEHLLSQCAGGVLRHRAGRPVTTAGGRPVLLACAAGELHSLPLDALAAALSEIGVPARVLGAAVPQPAIHRAVRRLRPAALFLWSQLPATGDPARLADVPATRPPLAVVAGGPGWPASGLPKRVRLATDLPTAVGWLREVAFESP